MGKTIMIVDDSVAIRQALNASLSINGYEVVEAVNGEEALQKLSESIDLVICDVNMPKINGVEVLKMVKSCDELKSIPVTMLTTTGNIHEIKRCYELGCNNYVIKPIKYEDFKNAIHYVGLFLKVLSVPDINMEEDSKDHLMYND